MSPSAQGVSSAPERIVTVDPRIPTKAAWIRGVVVVRFEVRLDGTTANVEIVKSLDAEFGLDIAAVEAVKQWRFKPAMKNGFPIVARVTASLGFNMRPGDPGWEEATRPLAPVPPPSAWPWSLTADATEPAGPWKPDTVKLGETTLRFESPAGWNVRNYPQGAMLMIMMSPDGRRAAMVGGARKMPRPLPLPLPADSIDAFGKAMSTTPGLNGGKLQATGQIRAGEQWWIWLDILQGADMLNRMPPEMREIFNTADFSELRTWAFITGHGDEMVQVMFIDWLPSGTTTEREAELKTAASSFSAILSKMTLSK